MPSHAVGLRRWEGRRPQPLPISIFPFAIPISTRPLAGRGHEPELRIPSGRSPHANGLFVVGFAPEPTGIITNFKYLARTRIFEFESSTSKNRFIVT